MKIIPPNPQAPVWCHWWPVPPVPPLPSRTPVPPALIPVKSPCDLSVSLNSGITRDDRLAEILSYIRYAWDGKTTTIITKDEVKDWRNKLKDRTTPWTDEELKKSGD